MDKKFLDQDTLRSLARWIDKVSDQHHGETPYHDGIQDGMQIVWEEIQRRMNRDI